LLRKGWNGDQKKQGNNKEKSHKHNPILVPGHTYMHFAITFTSNQKEAAKQRKISLYHKIFRIYQKFH